MKYSNAQENECSRPEYLDFFFSRNPCEDANRLIYNRGRKPSDDKIIEFLMKGYIDHEFAEAMRKIGRESTELAFLVLTPSTFGDGMKQDIFVNPEMFNLDETVFAYSMVDHEYFHAKDFRYGITFPGLGALDKSNVGRLEPETVSAVLETRAILNQILQGEKKNISKKILKSCADRFLRYHGDLRFLPPENRFEEMVMKAQVDSYRPMLSRILKCR